MKRVNERILGIEKKIGHAEKVRENEKLHIGVDLGTAYTVMVVLGEDFRPIACEMEFAQVIKDGLVVDFLGAQKIVRRLKEKIENQINLELTHAATAIPPGTQRADAKSHMYVIEGTGMEVIEILDEPTAANNVLNLQNGAVIDIGGGTTGVSILKNGQVIHTYDEATGGTHLSLVLAGRYGISMEEAEEFKKKKKNRQEVLMATRPVLEKMATIVKKQIDPYHVEEICLVGGTSLADGIEKIFQDICQTKVIKPKNPLLVTPLGIAMADKGE